MVSVKVNKVVWDTDDPNEVAHLPDSFSSITLNVTRRPGESDESYHDAITEALLEWITETVEYMVNDTDWEIIQENEYG